MNFLLGTTRQLPCDLEPDAFATTGEMSEAEARLLSEKLKECFNEVATLTRLLHEAEGKSVELTTTVTRLVHEAEGKVRELAAALNVSERRVQALLNSRSWRITRPLRALGSILNIKKKIRPKGIENSTPLELLSVLGRIQSECTDTGVIIPRLTANAAKPEPRNSATAKTPVDFDAEWYLKTYTDVARAGVDPLTHYIQHGQNEGRHPSFRHMIETDFDADWYLQAYPDVAASGLDPFEHFIQYGNALGRLPNASPRLPATPFRRFGPSEYGARLGSISAPLSFDSHSHLDDGFSLSIAVHLHLYHIHLLEDFIKHLDAIPTRFDLFVSIPREGATSRKISRRFRDEVSTLNNITVVRTDNVGRDIYPFVVVFGQELLKYDVVLHIHSKESRHQTKGWRRFLLHYTLGNRSIVTQILNLFHRDPKLGALFPAYFHGITRQPTWGANRQIVIDHLARLGFSFEVNRCPDFPAGSFFWARSDALRPVLDHAFTIDDFDGERGQVDGTLAHGIERLFGVAPLLRGYSTAMRFVDSDYRLVNYFDKERVKELVANGNLLFERDRRAEIDTYRRAVQNRGGRKPRIALVTAIIGPFDALLLPNILEAEVDYYCFSDSISDGYGVFHLDRPPYLDADPRRSARYIKTNLFKYIKGYDYVVWIDGNVELRARLSDLVERVASSGCKVGAIVHPVRDTYRDEVREVLRLELDDAAVIDAQSKRYQSIEELNSAPLIETNFMIFDAREEAVHEFMRLWWNEINTYSRRDQLSVNYALNAAGVHWHPLLEDRRSARDADEFALFGHGLNQWGPQPHIYASWHDASAQDVADVESRVENDDGLHQVRLDLDVVVCVHNALDDVKICLHSLDDALCGRGNIIIVDDASDLETSEFLEEYARAKRAKLIRHNTRLGYTKSANSGVRAGGSRNVLLLNSDTIVPPGAIDKLCGALDEHPCLGVVGPLSNAASTQSVPSTKGTVAQTAINPLPSGVTPADMDEYFESHWNRQVVRVPLVHGFCFGVKRAVFDAVGLFDEESFPHGYGEENDFCFRAADAGFDLAVLTNTYIYHAKSKSYSDDERTRLMTQGMDALIRKHSLPRIERSLATMNAQPALKEARELAQKFYGKHLAIANKPHRRSKSMSIMSLSSPT